MTKHLAVYQYREHDLIQLTDGREVHAADAHRGAWVERQTVPATVEGVARVSAKAPSEVLEEIERQGYADLKGFEIQEDWRKVRVRR
jgi:hypothetical protein